MVNFFTIKGAVLPDRQSNRVSGFMGDHGATTAIGIAPTRNLVSESVNFFRESFA
ncbi:MULTISPECIES: hypothetical protein [Planktothricoides]|uniref:Uncharacterized protein n=2 Tax=Planktothricoides raciborskii TaxID=132608 RepID=A0AAU8JJV2_9CYAN|nr:MULTISPECIES: hypothetical protein [Planktothricoides]MBD2546061.1 hypothetical protein [Planktothricoides raciborskii FACHB-1370]MBD2584319.1 hypothetical protein [Planktothricoides raciborskii FACHB-1261]